MSNDYSLVALRNESVSRKHYVVQVVRQVRVHNTEGQRGMFQFGLQLTQRQNAFELRMVTYVIEDVELHFVVFVM
jgi:hypothetical protein